MTDSEQIADNCSQSVKPFLMMLSMKAEEMRAVRCRFFDDAEVYAQSSKPKIPDLPEFPVSELLHMENEIAGMYLSGHPLDEYTTFSKAIHADKNGRYNQ